MKNGRAHGVARVGGVDVFVKLPSRTLLNAQLDLAVKLGNVLVPARSLQSVLGQYCQHLFVWTHDDTFKIQITGSSIPLLFKGRYFVLCSKHQLEGVNPQDVCIMFPDGSIAVTCSGYREFKAQTTSEGTDAYDIVAFEFTDPCDEHTHLKSLFFDFTQVPPDVPSDHVLALVVVGYASADQDYNVEHENHLGSVKRNITASLEGQPDDSCLFRAKYIVPLDVDPDGLSGSPVFVVQKSEENGQIGYLAGMVLRSSREKFYFLKSGFIEAFLGSFVDD